MSRDDKNNDNKSLSSFDSGYDLSSPTHNEGEIAMEPLDLKIPDGLIIGKKGIKFDAGYDSDSISSYYSDASIMTPLKGYQVLHAINKDMIEMVPYEIYVTNETFTANINQPTTESDRKNFKKYINESIREQDAGSLKEQLTTIEESVAPNKGENGTKSFAESLQKKRMSQTLSSSSQEKS